MSSRHPHEYISPADAERFAGLRSLVDFVTKGITAVNAMSRMSFANNATNPARFGAQVHGATGLGPNQLSWLRSNIESFKQAEDQRVQLRQDARRAARIAGLI